ncbi:hypothetical protein ACN47E_008638 [Coniothyrium glycines]
MMRKDSGFVEPHHPKLTDKEQAQVHQSNTAPNRRNKATKGSTESKTSAQTMDAEPRRPASERHPKPTRKTSSTSSENSTSRSKGLGHSSKLSSRRTSCTIVDPSRPARHYRIKSSQSVPTATSQDIDDVLALHFRSCSLFSNPSYHSHSGLPSPSLSQREFTSVPSRFSTEEMPAVTEIVPSPTSTDDGLATPEKTNTTMHWTSPGTRRRDYERIDKANSGFRGLIRRVVPRCVSGPQEKFYEKDQSDAGSVRRYRMDDVEDQLDEKDALRKELSKLKRPSTQGGQTKMKWACF